MALEKATTYKSFKVPNGYSRITSVSYKHSGGEAENKTYIVEVHVGTYKDDRKAQLLDTDRHVFTMTEPEINMTNLYEELKKIGKYSESIDV